MADEALARELADLSKTLKEHFKGDDEFQGGLARDLRAVMKEIGQLRLDFETYKAGDEGRQARWRKLLDPAEGGGQPVKVELNGMLKQIVAVAVGAGGAAALLFEGLKFLLEHWRG